MLSGGAVETVLQVASAAETLGSVEEVAAVYAGEAGVVVGAGQTTVEGGAAGHACTF